MKHDILGRWWHQTEDSRFQCDLCPRSCVLKPGQPGFCYIRQAQEDGIHLTSYGRSSGFCIDPIEKKPLYHFYPGSSVLSFGTAGCNLGCRFCQNWDISKARSDERLLSEASPEAIAEAAERHGSQSVAFTYNDPVIFAEYAIDTAKACQRRGIRTVAVSAGYVSPGAREEFFEVMDAANIDLKGFTEEFYRKFCLVELKPVLETLQYLAHQGKTWVELTTLLIPGANDSESELCAMSRWVVDHMGPYVPLHFTAFHPDFKLLDRPATPGETLTRARQIAMAEGLKFVYTGNVHDPEGSSTYCPNCGELLIERDWYEMGQYKIRDGQCSQCGQNISGHFGEELGRWGARRVPIQI